MPYKRVQICAINAVMRNYWEWSKYKSQAFNGICCFLDIVTY